jgi:hypothetical protein
LKALIKRNGYAQVRLSRGSRQDNRWISIHRLVAIAFLGEPTANQQVNHRNGLKADNRLANLDWTLPRDNTKHAFITGLRCSLKGAQVPWAKLTVEEVREIRRQRGCTSHQELANRYGVSRSTISLILEGKNWRHC